MAFGTFLFLIYINDLSDDLLNNLSPKYLLNVIPTAIRAYIRKNDEELTHLKLKDTYFKNFPFLPFNVRYNEFQNIRIKTFVIEKASLFQEKPLE